VFPWLMIASATLFFPPGWPRRWVPRSRAVGREVERTRAGGRSSPARRLAVAAGVLWVALQVLFPLRHLLYPGDARWTNEGYRFAWNVLAAERAGDVSFRLPTRTPASRGRTTPEASTPRTNGG
jgi:hypothetical protein